MLNKWVNKSNRYCFIHSHFLYDNLIHLGIFLFSYPRLVKTSFSLIGSNHARSFLGKHNVTRVYSYCLGTMLFLYLFLHITLYISFLFFKNRILRKFDITKNKDLTSTLSFYLAFCKFSLSFIDWYISVINVHEYKMTCYSSSIWQERYKPRSKTINFLPQIY